VVGTSHAELTFSGLGNQVRRRDVALSVGQLRSHPVLMGRYLLGSSVLTRCRWVLGRRWFGLSSVSFAAEDEVWLQMWEDVPGRVLHV